MHLKVVLISIFLAALPACAASRDRPANRPLTDNQLLDVAKHPARWDRRVAWLLAYPFDNGFSESAPLCLERCGAAEASKSPFLIYTTPGRFKGYGGQERVLVQVRIDTGCLYRDRQICPEDRFVTFTEVR